MSSAHISTPRVLVTGSEGMLARDLLDELESHGISALGMNRSKMDITSYRDTRAAIALVKPQIVVNCAAYSKVDGAESEAELAFPVNRDGPSHLAGICRDMGVALIHISTDYVFDGAANHPYEENDAVNPINTYGRSKWEGEEAIRSRLADHLIVRTSWLFGSHGSNFVKTILRLAKSRHELRVVADQHGCPTSTVDLSRALAEIIRRILDNPQSIGWGTYHFCGKGETSWHGFARAILEIAGEREAFEAKRVIPITTADYPTPARRPAWSVLDCSKIRSGFGITPRSWRLGLGEMIEELSLPE
jgi:dTDP-4-dehydrorhamnose reductase